MLKIAKDYKPYKAKTTPVDIYGNTPRVLPKAKTEGRGNIGKQGYTLREVQEIVGLDKSQVAAILNKPAHSLTRYLIAKLDDDWVEGYLKAQEVLNCTVDDFKVIYRGLSRQNKLKQFCEDNAFKHKYYSDTYWKVRHKKSKNPNIVSLTRMYEFVEAYMKGV